MISSSVHRAPYRIAPTITWSLIAIAASRVKNRFGRGGKAYPRSLSAAASGPGWSSRPSISVRTRASGARSANSRANGADGTTLVVS